jgi:hypothetical protein
MLLHCSFFINLFIDFDYKVQSDKKVINHIYLIHGSEKWKEHLSVIFEL